MTRYRVVSTAPWLPNFSIECLVVAEDELSALARLEADDPCWSPKHVALVRALETNVPDGHYRLEFKV